MNSIQHTIAKGAVLMIGFKMLERSIGLLSTIILARLLNPSDFGLVAMAFTFVGLLNLFNFSCFENALIQKQNAERHLYDTAWTFNLIFEVSLSLVLLITAIPLSKFYNEARLENILYVIAFGKLLGSFINIGPVAFMKDMQFHKEFNFLLIKKLSSFTVCIILAFTLRDYWALVWGIFTSKIVEVFLSYRLHPYRPRFCLSGRKELFHLSIWMFVNNAVFFANQRMADFVISKMLGSQVLGIYTIAYELSNLPTTELVAPLNRAVFPGYSKMADDPDAIRQGFLNVFSMIALCIMPAGIGIALVAEPMILVVFGEKWREAIPLVQILAVSGVLVALQHNVGTVYMALQKARYITIIDSFSLLFVFLPLLIVLMQQDGVIGVAKAYLYNNIIILPVNYFIISRLLKIRLMSILTVFWRPVLACGLMFVSNFYLRDIAYLYAINYEEFRLLIEVLNGVITYGMSIVILWYLNQRPDGAKNLFLQK